MPKAQTIASNKYQRKVGIIAKSYKLRRELTEAYADACKKTGVSQSAQLTKMMQEFIDSVN